MIPEVLYIHGFASSSLSYKARLLEEFFSNVGYYNIIHPNIPVAPKKAMNFIKEIITYNPIKLIIGSSLGGFYALAAHQDSHLPTVLINPALEPHKTLKDFTGVVKKFNTEDFFIWTEDHVKQLQDIYFSLNFNNFDQDKLYFYLSKNDEFIDHSNIPNLFPKAHIKFFDNCRHRFDKFELILPEILDIYIKYTNPQA